MAKQNCTKRIEIEVAEHLEDLNQGWLIVEGSLGINSSEQVDTYSVDFSLGLECGQAHNITAMNYCSDAAISE